MILLCEIDTNFIPKLKLSYVYVSIIWVHTYYTRIYVKITHEILFSKYFLYWKYGNIKSKRIAI